MFVGEVLHSDAPRTGPFSEEKDLPQLQAALLEAFGVPLKIQVDTSAGGDLLPLKLALQQAENATATLPGFVSRDGSTVLLGSFRPFNEDPRRLREKMLSASPGVRVRKAAWYVNGKISPSFVASSGLGVSGSTWSASSSQSFFGVLAGSAAQMWPRLLVLTLKS